MLTLTKILWRLTSIPPSICIVYESSKGPGAQASLSVWLLVVPNLMYMLKGVNGDYRLVNYGHKIERLANIGPKS